MAIIIKATLAGLAFSSILVSYLRAYLPRVHALTSSGSVTLRGASHAAGFTTLRLFSFAIVPVVMLCVCLGARRDHSEWYVAETTIASNHQPADDMNVRPSWRREPSHLTRTSSHTTTLERRT